MSDLLAARVQRGATLGFHIVLACLGVGMPVLLLPEHPAAAGGPAAWSTAAHAPDRVLRALLGTTAAGAALLVPSLAFLFRVFKAMPKSEPTPARE